MRRGLEPEVTVNYWEDRDFHNLTAALVPRTGYTENALGPRNKLSRFPENALGHRNKLFQILQKMLLVPGTNFSMDLFSEKKFLV